MADRLTLMARLSDGRKVAFKMKERDFTRHLNTPKLLEEAFFLALPEVAECTDREVDLGDHMYAAHHYAAFAPKEAGLVFIDFLCKEIWTCLDESFMYTTDQRIRAQYIHFARNERLEDGCYPAFNKASKPYPSLSLITDAVEARALIVIDDNEGVPITVSDREFAASIVTVDLLSLSHDNARIEMLILEGEAKLPLGGSPSHIQLDLEDWMINDAENHAQHLDLARHYLEEQGLLNDVDRACFEMMMYPPDCGVGHEEE
ncbi:hypothetical protein YA0089_14310 [Pseudomonas viridiflava]|uniref:hypothetical protein n=1 Tax=Pseudomonas viridiflava TaxID=33069 RepID=UPI0018E5F216|nr:hypothetical protein [Pseudomonas viridiflava]MBI6724792.1 hypothetical protein [Pseudomonas viridiflava]